MKLTPEVIEAIIAGLILGLGMVIYRIYQYQTKDSDHESPRQQDAVSSNGFRVAMETVKEAHSASVELLHEQIDHMETHVIMLEQQNIAKDAIIDRLQELLLAQGIITNEEEYVISNRKSDVQE